MSEGVAALDSVDGAGLETVEGATAGEEAVAVAATEVLAEAAAGEAASVGKESVVGGDLTSSTSHSSGEVSRGISGEEGEGDHFNFGHSLARTFLRQQPLTNGNQIQKT